MLLTLSRKHERIEKFGRSGELEKNILVSIGEALIKDAHIGTIKCLNW